MLERDMLEVFYKATSLNAIKYNWNNLDNDFEYLFLTLPFLVHNVDRKL